jgi:hypothetical protein
MDGTTRSCDMSARREFSLCLTELLPPQSADPGVVSSSMTLIFHWRVFQSKI